MSPLPSKQPSLSRHARALIAPATVFVLSPYKTRLAFAATPLPIPLSISTTPLQSTMTDIMVGVAAAAAGVVLGRLTPTRNGNGREPPCERCSGSGKIDCEMCKRWHYSAVSNGGQKEGANINKATTRRNVHCTSCHGSLRTQCPRCRGGGTAAPILARMPVPVRIDDGFNSLRRFAQQTLIR